MQAIVLCGGKGMRLRPLTDILPKPLVQVRGRPIVDYIVALLEKHGVTDIIVAAGYKASAFHEHFAEHRSVRVVDTGDVDIILRLIACAPYMRDDFLVLYGDTVSDVNLAEVIAFHNEHSERVTVTAWPLRTQFGLMDVASDGKVTTFLEKPQLDKWINIGHFYFAKEIVDQLKGFSRFEDFLRHLVDAGDLNAYRHTGVHITINTRKELEEAEDDIARLGLD
jgi:glucose-1-phosphate cytidylyltransferase